jgi:hypothetical protein
VIERLETGNLKVVIYFENDKDAPFEIAILGPGE